MAQLIIITGPSGAGKTTTSELLLLQLDGVWAYVNQDEIRQLVRTGYASAGGYEKEWSDETRRQWAVSLPLCTDMIKRYHEYGINVLLDCFAPADEFQQWQQLLDGLDYEQFVLLPDVETTVQRNAGRSERSRLKENKIRQNHARFAAWAQKPGQAHIIDTSHEDAEQSVKALSVILRTKALKR